LSAKRRIEFLKALFVAKSVGRKRRAKKRRRAILLANQNGKIEFVDHAARRWLKEFFGRPARRGTLPRKLHSWLSKTDRGALPRSMLAEKRSAQLHLRRHDSLSEQSIVVLLELIKGKKDSPRRRLRQLTSREDEVLAWIARGKSNSEIASILGISAATVGKHLERIYPKLGVENRTAAANFASELQPRQE
jgi:DNA-binding NarL/FixJ family response regulator